MQTPIMEWNTAKKIWQYSTDAHLFALWEPFLGTWPTAGIMRNGQVFELPTPAHHTTDSEFSSLPTPVMGTVTTATSGRSPEFRKGSNPNPVEFVEDLLREREVELLRTPTASQGEGGALGEEEARKRGNTVGIRDQAMDLAKLNGAKVSRDELNVLPTPMARDYKGDTIAHERNGKVQTDSVERAIFHSGEVSGTNWGKFEPAIRRWEEVLGRPAPAPTKPDGKDGAHRLSSAFTEFMMGLEPGWITDVGLTRNEELKACGNGVVPQQAELALRILLDGVPFESQRGGGLTVLPTPTVMDQRDGKHFRSVAIKDLANGNNRGLNLNNIVEAGLTNWNEGDKFEIVDGKAVKK